MKKWILGIGAFALAFAMLVTPTDSKVMAAGTTVTDGDAGTTVTGGDAGTTEQPKVDLCLDDSWVASWTPVEGAEYWSIGLYKDGKSVGAKKTSDTTADVSEFVDGSGTYQCRLYVRYPDDSSLASFSIYSDEKVYVEPEKKLDTTVGYWDNSKWATFNIPVVEGASRYEIVLCEKPYSSDAPGVGEDGWREGSYTFVSADSAKNGIVQYEFDSEKLKSWCYGDEGNKVYVKVRAISDDINSVANGELGEKSSYFDCRQDAEYFMQCIKALKGAGATADEMMNGKIKEREDGLGYEYYYAGIKQFSKYNLKLAMTESEKLRNEIDSIMKQYAEEKGIKVGDTTVSDDVSKYIKAEDITVVGAAGNGNDGETVKLEIGMPKQEESIDTKLYGKYVQLDLKLTSNSTAISELRVPVTIKMKAPTGIDTSKLVILHYHTSGEAPEIITPVVDGDNIIFSVSKFSTFVFAEVSDGDSGTTDGSTGGTTGGTDGGNTGGTTGGTDGGNTGGATGGTDGGSTGGNTDGTVDGSTNDDAKVEDPSDEEDDNEDDSEEESAEEAKPVKDNVPKTGDSLPIALPMTIAIILAGAAVVLRKKVN